MNLFLIILMANVQLYSCFWPFSMRKNERKPRLIEKSRILSISEQYSTPSKKNNPDFYEVEQIFSRVGFLDECRQSIGNILLQESDCKNLNSNEERKSWREEFTLQVTNCHLASHNRPSYHCRNKKQCFDKMTESDFQIYSMFYLAAERICFEINQDRWQTSVEELISVLHKNTIISNQNIQELSVNTDNILHVNGQIQDQQNVFFSDMQEQTKQTFQVLKQQKYELERGLETSEATLKELFLHQENLSKTQEKSLDVIVNRTEAVQDLISKNVMHKLQELGEYSSSISSELKESTFLLVENSKSMKKLQENIDQTFSAWQPLFDQIFYFSLNSNLTLQSLETLVFYSFSWFSILFFTSFTMLKEMRLTSSLILFSIYFGEHYLLPEMLKYLLSRGLISDALNFETLNRDLTLGVRSLSLLFFLVSTCSFLFKKLRSKKNLTLEEAQDILDDLKINLRKSVSSSIKDKELIDLLINELVQLRIEAAKKQIRTPKISMKLEQHLIKHA
eukprot:snap_masked-scaffold_24-processed-gene-2.45-mRNA-1 protein AED:1.00 eAED:1.00 QI:0/-1/0/0/-1/1/1/0/506